MEESKIKEVLDFLLSSYRAKLAIQNPSESCPFDFQGFLTAWKGKYGDLDTLKSTMEQNLSSLMTEGIFDSIIPYLASSMNQAKAKLEEETQIVQDQDQDPSSTKVPLDSNVSSSIKSKTRKSEHHYFHKKETPPEEKVEILIHVCDESKNLKQDFKCEQSLLVQEMGYFSRVTMKGQKLKDMDISVHCDIAVFDWLMKWVKAKANGIGNNNNPILEPSTVVGLMVSAEFLQMPSLTAECVAYAAQNIEDVIVKSPNLGCLTESLTNKLSTYFNNIEIERKIGKVDRNDRITSRLYTQLILGMLNDLDGESSGNYSSASTLFRCTTCGKLLVNKVAPKVPCASMRMDSNGRVYAIHAKDGNWTLQDHLKELKKELKSWRRVYWRVWATIHFLPCSVCKQYFPVKDLESCKFHPKPPKLQVKVNPATGEVHERVFEDEEQQGNSNIQDMECINPFRKQKERLKCQIEEEPVMEIVNFGFGEYPCCRKPGYKFYPLPQTNGCQTKDHTILKSSENEPILKRISMFRDLIICTASAAQKDGKGKSLEWGGIHELSPPKLPVTPWGHQVRVLTLPKTLTFRATSKSSSTDSNNSPSFSDTEDGGTEASGEYSTLPPTSCKVGKGEQLSDFWCWNNDFTTRYNQDMQREKEEKLMADLELLLSQRVQLEGLEPRCGSPMRFGYLANRKTGKNVGGSFIKLEEKWREEQQKLVKITQRQVAKSAKN